MKKYFIFYLFTVTNLFSINANSNLDSLSINEIEAQLLEGEVVKKGKKSGSQLERAYVNSLSREYSLIHLARLKELDVYRQLLLSDTTTLQKEYTEIVALIQDLQVKQALNFDELQYYHSLVRAKNNLLREYSIRLNNLTKQTDEFCSTETLRDIDRRTSFDTAMKRKIANNKFEAKDTLSEYKNRLNSDKELFRKLVWHKINRPNVRITEELTEDQINDLRKKISLSDQKVNEIENQLRLRGYNIDHETDTNSNGTYSSNMAQSRICVDTVCTYVDNNYYSSFSKEYNKLIALLGRFSKLNDKYNVYLESTEKQQININVCQIIKESLGAKVHSDLTASLPPIMAGMIRNEESLLNIEKSSMKLIEQYSKDVKKYVNQYSHQDIIPKLKAQRENDLNRVRTGINLISDFMKNHKKNLDSKLSLEWISLKLLTDRYFSLQSNRVNQLIKKHSNSLYDLFSKYDFIYENSPFINMSMPTFVDGQVIISNSSSSIEFFKNKQFLYYFKSENYFNDLMKKFYRKDSMPLGEINFELTDSQDPANKGMSSIAQLNTNLSEELFYLNGPLINQDLQILNKINFSTSDENQNSLLRLTSEEIQIELFFQCQSKSYMKLENDFLHRVLQNKTWDQLLQDAAFNELVPLKCHQEIRLTYVNQIILSLKLRTLCEKKKNEFYRDLISKKNEFIDKNYNCGEK